MVNEKENIGAGPYDKIGHHAQVGGIEVSVLQEGAGRGCRIAWINTGTGLRYKVVIDRAMDIAETFYNAHSLAWISHLGVAYPEPFSNHGLEWLRTFGGGLLTTCGLTHVGGPEADAHGQRGLHDEISNIPATIESIIQPDLLKGNTAFSITGVMRQTKVFGPHLQLRRTISGNIGEASIHIKDEVSNRGNSAAPHMMMYHFNLGWPLMDAGTNIIWKGSIKEKHGNLKDATLNEKNDFKKCFAPSADYGANREAVAFIDPDADADGLCQCGLYNPKIDMALRMRFRKSLMPWLTVWQHYGIHEYVTGIEPCTHPPIGQAKAREKNTLVFIQPGETKTYETTLEVLTGAAAIQQFIQSC